MTTRKVSSALTPVFLRRDGFWYSSGGGGLDIFPKLSALLPNWTVSYGGLAKLPKMKKVFKSFNLNHAYKTEKQAPPEPSAKERKELEAKRAEAVKARGNNGAKRSTHPENSAHTKNFSFL